MVLKLLYLQCLVFRYKNINLFHQILLEHFYGTDLMQRRTRKWHALESNPLSTKMSSIHYRVRVDALVKYAPRKHSQQALTE